MKDPHEQSSYQPKKLSIVLPCYNEARSLYSLVERYAIVKGPIDLELILVDNGSSDDTPAMLMTLAAKFPFIRPLRIDQNKGYGDGIWQGLLQARGTWIGWSHADLQTDPKDTITAFEIASGAREPRRVIVKGSRSGRSVTERLVTRGMQIAALALLRRNFHEINAQPKVFHRDLLKHLRSPPTDFNFDVYVLYRARLAGWKFIEIPVRFPPRQHGHSNWSRTWTSRLRTIRRSIIFMATLGAGLRRDS